MLGLNAVALVFFGCLNFAADSVCRYSEEKRKRIIKTVCSALLIINLIKYGIYYPLTEKRIVFPVEFSAVAYFTVPVILLISKKKFRSWAAYSGLMAGFFYYMAMIFAGGPLYNLYPAGEIYVSLFCHGSIYFCGLAVIKTERLSKNDAPLLIIGVAYIAFKALILKPFVLDSQRLFIYILLDAVFIKQQFSANITGFILPVYYLAIAVFILISVHCFFKQNRKLYKKYENSNYLIKENNYG